MTSLFLDNLEAHAALCRRLPALEPEVLRAGRLIADALEAGGKLLVCGNGGSAADAQHIASELTGRFVRDRRALAALSLVTDTSALTSIGNDYSFDHVFSRQVEALGRAGDVLLAISTSGSSPNAVRAVEAARAGGLRTIGLLGRDGGRLRDACECSIVVPSDVTARIQEAHLVVAHTLCGIVEQTLGLA